MEIKQIGDVKIPLKLKYGSRAIVTKDKIIKNRSDELQGLLGRIKALLKEDEVLIIATNDTLGNLVYKPAPTRDVPEPSPNDLKFTELTPNPFIRQDIEWKPTMELVNPHRRERDPDMQWEAPTIDPFKPLYITAVPHQNQTAYNKLLNEKIDTIGDVGRRRTYPYTDWVRALHENTDKD